MKKFKDANRRLIVYALLAALTLLPFQFSASAVTTENNSQPSISSAAVAEKNFQLYFPSAARTSTPTPVVLDLYGAETLVCYLSVTAASGTSPTLDVKFQDSPDGGTTWFDIAGASFTQATSTTSQVVTATRKFGRKVRCVPVIGGTTPSFTFSVTTMSY